MCNSSADVDPVVAVDEDGDLNMDTGVNEEGGDHDCSAEIVPKVQPAKRKQVQSVRVNGAESEPASPQGNPAYADRHGYMQNDAPADLPVGVASPKQSEAEVAALSETEC